MGIDGGMIGPIIAELIVTAALKGRENPFSIIARADIAPTPDVSAIADPDIPEKMIEVRILTWLKPPGKWPTSLFAKSNIRKVILPWFMICAARIKNGTAKRVKLRVPLNIIFIA